LAGNTILKSPVALSASLVANGVKPEGRLVAGGSKAKELTN